MNLRMGQQCEDSKLPRGESDGRFSWAEHPRGTFREKAQGEMGRLGLGDALQQDLNTGYNIDSFSRNSNNNNHHNTTTTTTTITTAAATTTTTTATATLQSKYSADN